MAIRADVVGSFTGTGQSTAVAGLNGQLILTGTFVGTVVVEVQDKAGNWAAVASYTAPVGIKHEMAVSTPWRLNCTAYTSGTAVYEFVANEPATG